MTDKKIVIISEADFVCLLNVEHVTQVPLDVLEDIETAINPACNFQYRELWDKGIRHVGIGQEICFDKQWDKSFPYIHALYVERRRLYRAGVSPAPHRPRRLLTIQARASPQKEALFLLRGK